MAIIIKNYKGKIYYKVEPDGVIKENAIYVGHGTVKQFNQIANDSFAIEKTASDFKYHDFYNPVSIKVESDIKIQKFDVKNLYLNKKEIHAS